MNIAHVILFKIVVTVTLWCLPLLLYSLELFAWAGVPTPTPAVFVRLLGAAFLSLVVMYWHGWREARAGRYPTATVRAGFVSNAGATVVLVLHGASGEWNGWGWWAQAGLWGSAVLTAGISVGLLIGKAKPPAGSNRSTA